MSKETSDGDLFLEWINDLLKIERPKISNQSRYQELVDDIVDYLVRHS